MDLLSLLIGVLIGWAIEWVIDYFYWRNRNAEVAAELAETRAQLVTLRAENAAMAAGQDTAEIPKAAPEPEAMPEAAPAFAAVEAAAADDLTIIEGVGAKIAVVLNQNGIYSFGQLAATEPDELRAMLNEAGPEYHLADPTTWPEQAQLAAERDWVRLEVLQKQLTGGVMRSRSGLEDELTRIEGIGPKIAQLLNSSGIQTFSQLASTPSVNLEAILHSAGPEYAMAGPSSKTWKEQARLADQGRWQELLTLQEELKGGRVEG